MNQLGQRDAVLVARTPAAGGLQIFIGGKVLDDPADVTAGHLPGLSANEAFLDNLVRMAESAAASPPYARQVHDAFSQLERLLGRLVDEALRAINQTDRPEDYFPAKVRENITNRKTGRLEFGRCGYLDIVEIMRSNEQVFAPFFVPYAGADFIGFLKPVNWNQRVWMAHPHKAEQGGKGLQRKRCRGDQGPPCGYAAGIRSVRPEIPTHRELTSSVRSGWLRSIREMSRARKKIDAGRETTGSMAKKLGVGKTTLWRALRRKQDRTVREFRSSMRDRARNRAPACRRSSLGRERR